VGLTCRPSLARRAKIAPRRASERHGSPTRQRGTWQPEAPARVTSKGKTLWPGATSRGNLMTSEANFLAAIRENPDDDAVRLIFADWLEDQGDTGRAEFIRVQVERATLCPEEPRAEDLRDREEELLGLHRTTWIGGLEKLVDEVKFQRGLPEMVVVS